MAQALATKYRPQRFDDVVGQKYVIDILKKQVENNSISNCYLFAGPTGTGKTTLARIFANELNGGMGTPIEIDAASNNGVDNIRDIIEESQLTSLDSKYRVYIIDEAHMITLAGWNAFLKTLEEPTPTTIFILCTTEPQKIPSTILNRVMRFNLTKLSVEEIRQRLEYICSIEGFNRYGEACDYIAKLSNGGMRDAIMMLDKCSKYTKDLSVKVVQQLTGSVSYETLIALTNAIVDHKAAEAIQVIEDIYNAGYDLKVVLEQYLDFVLDVEKYILFNKDINQTKIPHYLEKQGAPLCVEYVVAFDGSNRYFSALVDSLLELKFKSKYDTSFKNTLEVFILNLCAGKLIW